METYIETEEYTIEPYSSLDERIEQAAPGWLTDLEDPPRERAKASVETVYEALEDINDEYPLNESVTVAVGETTEPFIEDEMGGATGGNFGHTFIVTYSPDAEGWQDSLEAATDHEYAHTRYYEQATASGQRGDGFPKWQQLLLEAHGTHVADEMTDTEAPWREAVSDAYLQENRDEIQDELQKEAAWTDHETEGMPFFGGGGDWQRWTGYTLAWRLGEQLMEERELADLPAMTYDETRDAVDDLLEA